MGRKKTSQTRFSFKKKQGAIFFLSEWLIKLFLGKIKKHVFFIFSTFSEKIRNTFFVFE